MRFTAKKYDERSEGGAVSGAKAERDLLALPCNKSKFLYGNFGVTEKCKKRMFRKDAHGRILRDN